MTLEKISRFVWLIVVWIMYDLAYDGIVLKSIHRNNSRANVNFDGNEAVVLGIIAFLVGTQVFYLFIQLFRKKETDDETDNST